MNRDYKIFSADCHIVEPPDLFEERIDYRFRDRMPKMEVTKNDEGRHQHAWFLQGKFVAPIGVTVQTGQRFKDPSKIDWTVLWPDVDPAGYNPHEYVKALDQDGVWGAVLQPSIGMVWWRAATDSQLLSAILRAYNDWIIDFIKPYPGRLRALACLNVDDVVEACDELERCVNLGLTGAFIPVFPGADKLYRNPNYDRLWWTAQELGVPLCLHLGTNRSSSTGLDNTPALVTSMTAAGRATNDYWVRYSMTDMVFSGVFDRYPRLKVGAIEHELAWIPHWLQNMDFTYKERPLFTKGWKSKRGILPSECWRTNMFATVIEDSLGLRLRDIIGVENMMWGNDFPHAESSWPKSREFLDKVFVGVPEDEVRKIINENTVKLYRFPQEFLSSLPPDKRPSHVQDKKPVPNASV